MSDKFNFFEFFAGGGMARAGLGENWKCLFANDFDPMKAATYCRNWGNDHFVAGDVGKVGVDQLPGIPDMVWASFPCQDLSLAGSYRGLGDPLNLTRSGTFWPFWELMRGLAADDRKPTIIVLENVLGTLTSRKGADFEAICNALAEGGYRFGAFVGDARHFVPQSRPRLFVVAVQDEAEFSEQLIGRMSNQWHTDALRTAHSKLATKTAQRWIWWNLPAPPIRNTSLADLIETVPTGCEWHRPDETARLLGLMSPLHKTKIEQAKASGKRLVGAIYKRTRLNEQGVKVQRAEVRFDGIAGCLRTPGGGSSRQTIILVEGQDVRSRLLSTREAARLMGLEDGYKLPSRYNDAYKVAGDGVCVPVVSFIATHLLEPLLKRGNSNSRLAA